MDAPPHIYSRHREVHPITRLLMGDDLRVLAVHPGPKSGYLAESGRDNDRLNECGKANQTPSLQPPAVDEADCSDTAHWPVSPAYDVRPCPVLS